MLAKLAGIFLFAFLAKVVYSKVCKAKSANILFIKFCANSHPNGVKRVAKSSGFAVEYCRYFLPFDGQYLLYEKAFNNRASQANDFATKRSQGFAQTKQRSQSHQKVQRCGGGSSRQRVCCATFG